MLLKDRLQKVMIDAGCYSFTQYFNYITQDKTGNAVMAMIDKVTMNHTFFMRESSHFDYFRSTVLPYLKATVHNRDLRIWCAASSTGEKPYTLAMRRKGSNTIGQDEKSCVVYGMPKVAYDLGGVENQVSLSNIPQMLYNILRKKDS